MPTGVVVMITVVLSALLVACAIRSESAEASEVEPLPFSDAKWLGASAAVVEHQGTRCYMVRDYGGPNGRSQWSVSCVRVSP